MQLIRQRLSIVEVFLLVIIVASALSLSLAVYQDIQIHNRFYADLPRDNPFTINATPISRAQLPVRLILITSLLVSFLGARSRKFVGLVISILGLLALIVLYLQWWRHSFDIAEARHGSDSMEMSHTLYLRDGNWLDIGVFLASICALGWMVAILILHFRARRGSSSINNDLS